ITTLGLLMDSSVVVIGGMLVAPLLFPILSIGMGIATSSQDAIIRALAIVGKSVLVVFLFSFLLSFLLNGPAITDTMQVASQATISHFLIAFVAGIVASFAWAKQDINATLPSIAVSVSLIPPLAVFGIGISMFEKALTSGAMFLFIINLLGIVLASVIVFSLFGFSNMHIVQEKLVEEERRQKEEEQRRRKQQEEQSGEEV
ncbi:DUF389 domain-containing protein, partial [candidate division KSB1 bacterium]|nr:DUF389 domain-containing protein [candidate division KSB1 bacterium]NIX71134.1 DUF389 domain-containing protein [candidate division KSB1 bacterium]